MVRAEPREKNTDIRKEKVISEKKKISRKQNRRNLSVNLSAVVDSITTSMMPTIVKTMK